MGLNFPITLPEGTVVGRASLGTGNAEAIPFASLPAIFNQSQNVKTTFGAVGNGVTDDSAVLIAAAAGSVGQSLIFPTGTYRVSNNVTFGSTTTLVFQGGASLLIDSGKTVTINGPAIAFSGAIASGAGTLTTGAGAVLDINGERLINIAAPSATGDALSEGNAIGAKTPSTINAVSVAANGFNLSPYVHRNMLDNAEMLVDQHNNGGAITPSATSTTFDVDRWGTAVSVGSKLTFQQVSDAPNGFTKSVKITVASQYAALSTDFFNFEQACEGHSVARVGLGTANALSSSLGVWIKSSVTGTLGGGLASGGLDRSYVFQIVISNANVWVFYPLPNIPGVTSGTFATDNTAGLYVRFDLGSGSNFETTANAWQNGNFQRVSGNLKFVNQTNGSTIQFAGPQYELGPLNSPFEYRTFDEYLQRCQYFLPAFNSLSGSTAFLGSGLATGTTTASVWVKHNVKPRVAPTGITVSSATHFNFTSNAGSNIAATAITFGAGQVSQDGTLVNGSVSAGFTQGNATFLSCSNASGQILFTGAELV